MQKKKIKRFDFEESLLDYFKLLEMEKIELFSKKKMGRIIKIKK